MDCFIVLGRRIRFLIKPVKVIVGQKTCGS